MMDWTPWFLSASLVSPGAPRGLGQVFLILSSQLCQWTLEPRLVCRKCQNSWPRHVEGPPAVRGPSCPCWVWSGQEGSLWDGCSRLEVAALLGTENIYPCVCFMHIWEDVSTGVPSVMAVRVSGLGQERPGTQPPALLGKCVLGAECLGHW